MRWPHSPLRASHGAWQRKRVIRLSLSGEQPLRRVRHGKIGELSTFASRVGRQRKRWMRA